MIEVDPFDILKVASLNLSQTTYQQVSELINKMNLTAIYNFKIPARARVFRIRRSEEEPFNHASQISYNPVTTGWGRVHKPNKPMFYGALTTPGAENPVHTVTAELLHILKNEGHKISKEPVNITVGWWRIIEPLPVIPVIYDEEYLKEFPIFQSIYDDFRDSSLTDERDFDMIRFIASEFSKGEIKNPKDDYKISVAFTEYCFKALQGKCEAIIYPSVRSRDKGINIAITPRFVNKYLKPVEVATFILRFDGEYLRVEDDSEIAKINDEGTFKLS